MRSTSQGSRLWALALWGALALCLSVIPAVAGDENNDGGGRWIFKYDRSQRELPPELKTPPRYMGKLTAVEQRRGEERPYRLKLDDLREGEKTVYLKDDTKVDGVAIKAKAKALKAKAPVAVYGQEKDGRFYAKSIFLIPDKEWEAILEAKQAEEERAKEEEPLPEAPPATEPSPPPEGPPVMEEGPPEAEEGPPVGLSEDELGVPKEGPEPQAAPPSQEKPAEAKRQGDFRATIKTVRSRGAEMSVVTEGKVVLVTTERQTTILEGDKKLRRSDLKDGWTVDVDVARWRGKTSCVAKRIWVVKR